jgi:predicted ATPase
VFDGDGLLVGAAVEALGRLVTRSLVVAEYGALSVRYRLLDTVRAYALRQPAAANETRPYQPPG